MTWCSRLGAKQNMPRQTQPQIKIKYQHQSYEKVKSTQNKSNIPDSVRCKKKIDCDVDTFVQCKKIRKRTHYVLNDFDASHQMLIFKLILFYLEHDDCIDFFKCCQKYGIILRDDAQLSYFWKFIHNRERRLAGLMALVTDASSIDYRSLHEQWQNKQFTIKYDPKYGHLTFHKEVPCFDALEGHSMIIVSQNPQKQKQKYLHPKCLATSNWYDVEDNDYPMKILCKLDYQTFRALRKSVKNPDVSMAKYIISNGLTWKPNKYMKYDDIIDGSCYGYWRLKVDL